MLIKNLLIKGKGTKKVPRAKTEKISSAKKTTVKNPRVIVLWNNDLISKYRELTDEGYETEDAWDIAKDELQTALDKEVQLLNKRVNGTLYLVGSIQKNETLCPAAKNLKTDNIGTALQTAVTALSKTDSRLTVSIAENELVITQFTASSPDLPSVFSFRCIDGETELTGLGADDIAEVSTSVAPIVRRAHRYKYN